MTFQHLNAVWDNTVAISLQHPAGYMAPHAVIPKRGSAMFRE